MPRISVYLLVLTIFVLAVGPDLIKLFRLIEKPSLNFSNTKYFFRINIIVLICGLTLSIILVSFEVNIFNYSAPIEYVEHDKISLRDFNGFKLPGENLQGKNEFAFITTSIKFEMEDGEISVEAYFHPARSYVYFNDLQNDDLLRHEMYHFHITEIWARNLRKELSNMSKLEQRKEVQQLHASILDSEKIMQMEYDFGSDHGYLLGRQIEWQQKIDSLLRVLSPFSKANESF